MTNSVPRRSGGRGDCLQALAEVGLREEENRKEQGEDSVRRGQLLGQDPRRRVSLDRCFQLRGLRTVHARLRNNPVQ